MLGKVLICMHDLKVQKERDHRAAKEEKLMVDAVSYELQILKTHSN